MLIELWFRPSMNLRQVYSLSSLRILNTKRHWRLFRCLNVFFNSVLLGRMTKANPKLTVDSVFKYASSFFQSVAATYPKFHR